MAFVWRQAHIAGWLATVGERSLLVIRPYIFKYKNFYLTVHNMWHHNELKICSKNLWNARLVLLKDKENKWADWADWYKIITIGEKGLLIAIAFLTAYAVVLEISVILTERTVKLTDLLLLFIYAEVLGMIAAFYKYRKIPITVPIFIAITALCRLIILQGKGINTIDLLYESGAVLLLAIAALVIRWNLINLVRPKDTDET